MAIGVESSRHGTPPGFRGLCDTRFSRPGEALIFRFRPGNLPCDHFGGRLFSILDLPLLLPDANGTGGRMQSIGLATGLRTSHKDMWVSNVNGGEWKFFIHVGWIVCGWSAVCMHVYACVYVCCWLGWVRYGSKLKPRDSRPAQGVRVRSESGWLCGAEIGLDSQPSRELNFM